MRFITPVNKQTSCIEIKEYGYTMNTNMTAIRTL